MERMKMKKKTLAFNPDTMTVRDVKDAVQSLRTLMENANRHVDREDADEAIAGLVYQLMDQWKID